MTRLQANLKILKILSKLTKENPQLRFHQLLWAYDILAHGRDDFYLESTYALICLKEQLEAK